MWNRLESLAVFESLEPIVAKLGYHCALAGSVLYRGHSDKDLDIILYPHNTEDGLSIDQLWGNLVGHFVPMECGKCASGYAARSKRDDKQVRWMKFSNGKRIDFFFLK